MISQARILLSALKIIFETIMQLVVYANNELRVRRVCNFTISKEGP